MFISKTSGRQKQKTKEGESYTALYQEFGKQNATVSTRYTAILNGSSDYRKNCNIASRKG